MYSNRTTFGKRKTLICLITLGFYHLLAAYRIRKRSSGLQENALPSIVYINLLSPSRFNRLGRNESISHSSFGELGS